MPNIGIKVDGAEEFDKVLAGLPFAMRNDALPAGIKASLKPAKERATALAPIGKARTGKKAGKKHLRVTIKTVVRKYRDGEVTVGVMGASWPEGAHAHLIEYGHDVVRDGKVVGHAPPQPFMRPAVEQTKSEQKAAFAAEISRIAAEAS